MQAAHEAVKPSFALASCGWTVGPLGARWYYDTVLPPSWTIRFLCLGPRAFRRLDLRISFCV